MDFSDALDGIDFDDKERVVEATTGRDIACPRCGGHRLEAHTQGKATAFSSWILLGIPLFFVRKGWKCSSCGKFFCD